MISVVIAAHNEQAGLGRTLAALEPAAGGREWEVVVVPNGCRDQTAAVARAAGAVVLELPAGGKAAAVNAGDRQAHGFPRAYLDADIVVPPGGLSVLATALEQPGGPLVVVPGRHLDASRSTLLVRAYSAVSHRLPAFERGLFGRGLIMMSAEARARFDELPLLVADDLFLDSLYDVSETRCCSEVVVEVEAPRTARDLVRRLIRVRRGNAALRAEVAAGRLSRPVRRSNKWSWWTDVTRRDPHLWPAAIVYVTITASAAVLARRPGRGDAPAWRPDRGRVDPVRVR